jgi:N-acetylglucosaminyl-diphospho-decaprenol L-rhamnosyltransferase
MMPDLSIVILSWNVADLLAGCLRSLPGAAGEWWARCEVIVVDNASSDGSVEMVRRDFRGVKLVALPANLGFSRGNNLGIREARGRYILLLNPDTTAHPGSIATLVEHMEAHPEVGIAGPRLLNPDGTLQPSRRRFPTPFTALFESTPLQRWFENSRLLRDFYMLDRPDGETQQVGWLSGAALMCRRETLDQIGAFDPGYFMFSEEVDLCRRASDAGWSVAYVPQAEITHYGGQSTGQNVPARHVNFNTSKARYFRLHEGKAVGSVVRLYLLGMYAAQTISEGAKWLLGHKRSLRARRLRMYRQVFSSRLKEGADGSRQVIVGAARWAALFGTAGEHGTPSPPGRPTGSPLPYHLHKQGVLLVTGEYPPARGGVGDYTCRLGAALHHAGIKNQVLTRKHPPMRQASGSRGGEIPLVAGRITLRTTLRALRGTRTRIAHIQYQTGAYEMRPTINLLPLLLKRKWGGITVVTFHDLLVPYLFPKAGPVREWANRLMARGADAAVATNPADAACLRAWGVRRVELIPIGSNIPNRPPEGYSREEWRAKWGARAGTTLLAYFGFLNSSKGLDDLLRALATLNGNGEGEHRPYRLLMVGGGIGSSDPTNRATAAYLDGMARELGVQGDLVWTGYLTSREVSAALLSADVAVLPYADGASFRRGSLMAVLEHGLPLVTTTPAPASNTEGQDSGWPRLVHGGNALLVPPGDTGALVEAVGKLAHDADLRARLAAGSVELSRYFGWTRIARLHKQLYKELLEK